LSLVRNVALLQAEALAEALGKVEDSLQRPEALSGLLAKT